LSEDPSQGLPLDERAWAVHLRKRLGRSLRLAGAQRLETVAGEEHHSRHLLVALDLLPQSVSDGHGGGKAAVAT
jgi:hypothetical protein